VLGHAQLVHGLDYATPTWHARAGSGGLVHFQVPTDPWYIFKCPRVVHSGCPPRLLTFAPALVLFIAAGLLPGFFAQWTLDRLDHLGYSWGTW
jgi:hypothetical protein